MNETKADKETYRASNDDLPQELFDAPAAAAAPNPVAAMALEIMRVAREMSLPISFDELQRFSIVAVAMQQDSDREQQKSPKQGGKDGERKVGVSSR